MCVWRSRERDTIKVLLFTINEGDIPASKDTMLRSLVSSNLLKTKLIIRIITPCARQLSLTLIVSSKTDLPSST